MPDVQAWPEQALRQGEQPVTGFEPAALLAEELSSLGLGAGRASRQGMDLCSGLADRQLAQLLRKEGVDAPCNAWVVCELMPYMFAACFTAPAWKGAVWMPQVQACANSAHVVLRSVVALCASLGLNAVAGDTLPEEAGHGEPDDLLLAELRRSLGGFVKCGAGVLLAMKCRPPDGSPSAYAQYPLRSMIGLMHGFPDLCAGVVEHSTLEAYLPHALAASAFVDIVLGKHRDTDKSDPTALQALLASRRGRTGSNLERERASSQEGSPLGGRKRTDT
jgi:hypothetical protein